MLHTPDLGGRAIDGRYELHALIGEGAFGRVYAGHDRRLERPIAIKVMKPWWAEDSRWVERFEREAKLLARVNDRGIVQIFDFGEAEEGPYYVAELVHGESLAGRLARGGVTTAEASSIATEICRALGSAHRQGIVHCDVKPANVMLTPDGIVKVGDFGVARLADGTSRAMSVTVLGTPRYMSPEQALGRTTTAATDVYSTGVVLYEMLAGRPPFQSGSAVELGIRHIQDEPPPLPAAVGEQLRAVVARALAKEPGERYSDGAEMAGALLAAAEGSHQPAPAGPPAEVRRRTPRAPAVAQSTGEASAPGVTIDLAAVRAAEATRPLPGSSGQKRTPPPPASRLRRAGSTRRRLIAAGCLAVIAGGLVVALDGGGAHTTVPELRGLRVAAAESALTSKRLKYTLASVPSPGTSPGQVVRQTPSAGSRTASGSVVGLSVAETPRWRPLSSFSGIDDGRSVAVQILGRRWRVNYEMSYTGTCLLIFTCLGPSAEAVNLQSGSGSEGFELNAGQNQTHTFATGPGTYRVDVRGGHDEARWAMTIEDFY